MGFTMKEKKALTNEIAARYRKESKKGKQAILDEFCRTTGYHRKYALQMLNRWGKKKTLLVLMRTNMEVPKAQPEPVAHSSAHKSGLKRGLEVLGKADAKATRLRRGSAP